MGKTDTTFSLHKCHPVMTTMTTIWKHLYCWLGTNRKHKSPHIPSKDTTFSMHRSLGCSWRLREKIKDTDSFICLFPVCAQERISRSHLLGKIYPFVGQPSSTATGRSRLPDGMAGKPSGLLPISSRDKSRRPLPKQGSRRNARKWLMLC